MWQQSPLNPLEALDLLKAPEASSTRGFCQVPLVQQEEFPCPLSGGFLRVWSLELPGNLSFQDCNHSC